MRMIEEVRVQCYIAPSHVACYVSLDLPNLPVGERGRQRTLGVPRGLTVLGDLGCSAEKVIHLTCAVESLQELRTLRLKFETHAQNFRDWVRTGGPVNPIWARETGDLKRQLHRAQRRAARRIFAATHQESRRCLGAFQVYREQRRIEAERRQKDHERDGLPPWQQQSQQAEEDEAARQRGELLGDPVRRSNLEALVPACNAVGRFERFGERDIVYICDYCDGHLVWEDLASMPAARMPLAPGDTQPNWQAGGNSLVKRRGQDNRLRPAVQSQITWPPRTTTGWLAYSVRFVTSTLISTKGTMARRICDGRRMKEACLIYRASRST